MVIDFQQGILTYPVTGNAQSFLLKTGQYVTLTTANGRVDFTVAFGLSNYLITESETVQNAWGPLQANVDYWLYWDIDQRTAVRTFGYTQVQPTSGPTAPTTPTNGQHWFNTQTRKMMVFESGGWRQSIRVFAARVKNSTFIALGSGNASKPFAGTQAGLNTPDAVAGRIIVDNTGTPIRRVDGRFFTTEDDFFVDGSPVNSIRLEANVVHASARENMAKFYVVRYVSHGNIELADYADIDNTIIAIAMEDIAINETGTVTVQGVVTNPSWNWPIVGEKLWVIQNGSLTNVDPHVTDPIVFPIAKPPIARVLSPTSIYFDQGLGGIGAKGDPGNKGDPGSAIADLATTVVAGVVRLSVPADDPANPVVVGINDPILADKITDQVAEGVTNLYFTQPRVRNTILAGLSTLNASPINSSNTVIDAFGRLQAQINTKQSVSERGVPNGYPPLDANGKIPTEFVPTTLVGGLSYQGTYTTGTVLPTPVPSNNGYYWVADVSGTIGGEPFGPNDWIISNGVEYQIINNQTFVSSVAGKSGDVLLAVQDISGAVASVNLIPPDPTGNVTLSIEGIAGLRDELDSKGDVNTVNGVSPVDGEVSLLIENIPNLQVVLDSKGTVNSVNSVMPDPVSGDVVLNIANIPSLISELNLRAKTVNLRTPDVSGNITIGVADINNLQTLLDQKGTVKSVNNTLPDVNGNVTLTAAKVGAVSTSVVGVPGGIATLDVNGKLSPSQIPAMGGGTVTSVNSVGPDGTGNIELAASDIGAVDQIEFNNMLGEPSGIATLDAGGEIPLIQIPMIPDTTVLVNASDDSTIRTQRHLTTGIGSAGVLSGGSIVVETSSDVRIVGGSALLRIANADAAELQTVAWEDVVVTVPNDNEIRYVGLVYVGGAAGAAVQLHTSFDWNNRNTIALGSVLRTATEVVIFHNPYNVGNAVNQITQRLESTTGVSRDRHVGGLMLSALPTRHIGMSSGRLWSRLNSYDVPAVDTSASSRFTTAYYNGSIWIHSTNTISQWDNLQYNDTTSGLTPIDAGNWSNLWVYLSINGRMTLVYGQSQFSSQDTAATQRPPTLLPSYLGDASILIGRLTFQQSATTAIATSAFGHESDIFAGGGGGGGVSVHGALLGLDADDHPQYFNTTRADARYVQLSSVGQPLGVPPLNSDSVIPVEFIPTIDGGTF